MSILVIDQAAELFWYVRGALRQEEIPLKHLTTVTEGEEAILHDLPQIVILNADAGVQFVTQIINKIRNHVFARSTIFLVFSTQSDEEQRRAFMVAGAGYVFHHKAGDNPPVKFFQSVIKWLLTYKNPDQAIFEFKPVTFKGEAEWTTHGRVGWITDTEILIESNLALSPGETLSIDSAIFNDLGLKNIQVQCKEKNTVGRYYQYANSLLCKIIFKNEKERAVLTSWVKSNQTLSKNKSIKILFFEGDAKYRETIRQMIKLDKQYCARGYSDIEDFQATLEYQLPELILINRALISKDKNKFEAIKTFIKGHFCYCVTYDTQHMFDPEEFKKNYEFALHTKEPIDLPLLEGMIKKLAAKKPHTEEEDKIPKVFCSKNSVYSRISLQSTCNIHELGETGVGIFFPFQLSNYTGIELTSHPFSILDIGHTQFFRVVFSKTGGDRGKGIYHRCLFLGNPNQDFEAIKEAQDLITKVGFDRWLVGDTSDDKLEKKK